MIEKIISLIQGEFPGINCKTVENSKQDILMIESQDILKVCVFLRDHKDLYFDFLSNITAVDYYPDNKFALVYNLASLPFQKQLTLRVELEVENRNLDNLPELPSVSSVWKTAEWHEREAFDLMGVFFTEHPDLRRILLPDDWQGFPLRKDYQDADSYHGISIKGE